MDVLTLLQYTGSGLSHTRGAANVAMQWLSRNVTAVLHPEINVANIAESAVGFRISSPILSRVITAIPVGILASVVIYEAACFIYNEYQISKYASQLEQEHLQGTREKESACFAKVQIEKFANEKNKAVTKQYDKLADKKLATEQFYHKPVISTADFLATTLGNVVVNAAAVVVTGCAFTNVIPFIVVGSGMMLAAKGSIGVAKKALYAYRIRCLNKEMDKIRSQHGNVMIYQHQQQQEQLTVQRLECQIEQLINENKIAQTTIDRLQQQLEEVRQYNKNQDEDSAEDEEFHDAEDTLDQQEVIKAVNSDSRQEQSEAEKPDSEKNLLAAIAYNLFNDW
ncbi:MAG: hypothetical protein OXC48_01350 [Endozoicomonadaceae bacterium]|nr:hypothetical protein [Endozoicomonadaceae bacterium]